MASLALPSPEHDSQAVQYRSIPRASVLEILQTYRRHIWLFLAVAGGVMAAAAIYTFAQAPRYTATAQLVIAPRPVEIGQQRTTAFDDPAADASVDTQVEVLRSRGLAINVADRLGFGDRARFQALMDEPKLKTGIPDLASKLGARSARMEPATAAARLDAAVERLQQGLDVHRDAQTFALDLAFTHADPAIAAAVVNTVAARFVDDTVAIKRTDSQGAEGLLRGQLLAARTEVENADAALGRYKVAHNLMSVQGGTLAEQQLSNMDSQLALAKAGEAEAAARLATARGQLAGGSTGDDLGEALGSPVIQQLRSQRAQLSAEVAEDQVRYGERHPKRVAVEHQLRDIDAQIQGEINRTISNLDAQRSVAAGRAASLSASAAQARGAVAGNNIASIPLAALQLRADTARSNYALLLNRTNELSAQSATARPDARITGIAPVPHERTSPNVPINLLVGALVAISTGLAAVFLRQGTDQRLRTLEDVEDRLRLPYLAGLPSLASAVRQSSDTDPVSAVIEHSESAYAESFRHLATAVLRPDAAAKVQTIALTSALPNEGKTTAAIGLARTLGLDGHRVVLVDADLRRPNVAATLGLQPFVGLQQVLEDKAALHDALILDAASGAYILPMVREGKPGSALLGSERFAALLAELKARFDVVLLDASPVLPVVDGRLVARQADATVVLARWSRTPDTAVELAVHMLRSLGVSLTGVALTRVDLNELARSGYGDPAHFLGTYKSYYA